MSFTTIAEYAFLTVCVAAAFGLAGISSKVLLGVIAGEPLRVPTPMLGIGTIVIAGWYWYGTLGGIRPLVRTLAAIGLVVGIVVLIKRRRSLLNAMRDLALPGIVAGGVAILMVFSLGSILGNTPPTVVSGGNNDIAAYALLGQHVADSGLDEPGSIVGYDAGFRAQSEFDTGAIIVTAASGAVGPFNQVWRYQLPLMTLMVGLLAYAITGLLDELAPGHRVFAALAGIASVSPILFSYLWSQYFLNQLITMGLMVATSLLIATGATRTTWRSRIAHAAAAALLIAPMVASYPHIGLLGPALLVPSLLIAGGLDGLLQRVGGAIAVGAMAIVGAAILMPTAFSRIVSTISELGSVEAGWPFPGYLPAEVLGLTSTMSPAHTSLLEWLPSVLILGTAASAAVLLVRARDGDRVGRFTILVLLTTFASYAAVYLNSGGPSYKQWKWITSFVPILVGAVVMTVMLAVHLTVMRRSSTDRAQRIALSIGLVYIAVAVSNAGSVTFPTGTGTARAVLSADLSSLEDDPLLEGIDAITVDLPPYWDTMWAAYFLRDVNQVMLAQPSYYSVAAPSSQWRLQSATATVPDDALEVRVVNPTLLLVRRGDPGTP